VKLTPRRNQVIGRIVIKRVLSTIVRPDETKDTTKFILIDAVGPDAHDKGLRVGTIILPTAMSVINLDGGVVRRPMVDEDHIAAILTEVSPDDLAVQTDSATEYVPLDSPRAALPLAESLIPEPRSSSEAA